MDVDTPVLSLVARCVACSCGSSRTPAVYRVQPGRTRLLCRGTELRTDAPHDQRTAYLDATVHVARSPSPTTRPKHVAANRAHVLIHTRTTLTSPSVGGTDWLLCGFHSVHGMFAACLRVRRWCAATSRQGALIASSATWAHAFVAPWDTAAHGRSCPSARRVHRFFGASVRATRQLRVHLYPLSPNKDCVHWCQRRQSPRSPWVTNGQKDF